MIPWTIYYDSGKVFHGIGVPDGSEPPDGVICIAQRLADRREIISGISATESGNQRLNLDWYYWHDFAGQWMVSDIHGLLLRHRRRESIRSVCQGILVTHQEFVETMLRADRETLGWIHKCPQQDS